MPTAVILSNTPQPSFRIIQDYFVKNLTEAEVTVVERPTPTTAEERTALAKEFPGSDTIFFHNTAGYHFQIIPGARNIALPAYEFSRLPEPWVKLLNAYDEIWVTTRHVGELLIASGVTAPILRLPPALDREAYPQKTEYKASTPFKFLFVGEPHFRKGVHFLMYGFVKAFPQIGQAQLIIKTSANPKWASLREDIKIVSERLPKEELLKLYTDSDVYISASLAEGLGLPIAEAILCGLPVCTNHWGGHKDLLTGGGYFPLAYREADRPWTGEPQFYTPGQKCALSDEDAVARAMQTIVKSSPDKRARMAAKARRHLLGSYGAASLRPFWLRHISRLYRHRKAEAQ